MKQYCVKQKADLALPKHRQFFFLKTKEHFGLIYFGKSDMLLLASTSLWVKKKHEWIVDSPEQEIGYCSIASSYIFLK